MSSMGNTPSQLPLCAGQPANNSRISLTGNIYRFGKRLEQRLDDVMRLFPIQQFQVQVGPRFVSKPLEKLASQTESESAGHVLFLLGSVDAFEGQFVQTAPNQVRPAAEVYAASGQAFVHRDVGFGAQRIARVEASAVAADAFLIPERLSESLAEGDSAILHRVMGIHLQVAFAAELEVDYGMFGEESQHVIEERDAGADGGLALAVNLEAAFDARFFGDAAERRAPRFHPADLSR